MPIIDKRLQLKSSNLNLDIVNNIPQQPHATFNVYIL